MSKPIVKLMLSCSFIFCSVLLHAQEVAEEEITVEETHWLVIHAGTLLAVPGKPPLSQQTVVIKDGRIDQITDGYAETAAVIEDPDAKITMLDLRDAFVLPGLMDMHVHLSFEMEVDGQAIYGASDEFVRQNREAQEDVYQLINAIGNAQKTLQAGFTTVRDVGSEGWHIFALRDAIRDGHLQGPRIFASGSAIRVGADTDSGACSGIESCRRATREQIDKGADVIKIYATCSGSKPCGYEGAPAVFMEDEVRAVVETAATRELSVAAHAHGTAGINLVASSGVRSIEHGSYNDKESRKIMIRNGVFLVPTLSVQDRIRVDIETASGDMLEVMQGFLDNHGPRMKASHDAGVKIAAGSDAGIAVHGKNARELEMYVDYGLTPEEAIVTATVNAAELLGKEQELGTIEAGKIGDLIAVREDPLENISALMEVPVVIQGGKIVKNTF